MSTKLALLHTAVGVAEPMARLCREILPKVETFHIVDESLLWNTIAAGRLTPATYWRVSLYVASAQAAGAAAVQVTCSSISPCVDVVGSLVDIPVLKIDEPMADAAVALGSHIGVIGTLSSTLEPTSQLLKSRARLAGKDVTVEPVLCSGAFEALRSGDLVSHDEAIRRELVNLIERVEVVVLAQASMARVLDSMPRAQARVPVLSSPRLAVERLRQILGQ